MPTQKTVTKLHKSYAWILICLLVSLVVAIAVTYFGSFNYNSCQLTGCVGGSSTTYRGFVPVDSQCVGCPPQYSTDNSQQLLTATIVIGSIYFVVFSVISVSATVLVRKFIIKRN